MSQHRTVELTTAQPPRTAPTGVYQMVDLEAAEHPWEPGPGTLLAGYAYNTQVPGPIIEATIGDTLLARFTNRLPEASMIHWHGLRVATAEDGSDPVPPGASVEYRIELPDAGTFWYHPDVRDPAQVERGLYGALVVRDPAEPRLAGERVLVFNHVQLNRRDLLLVNGIREPQMQIAAGQVERWRLVNASNARYLRLSLGGHRFHVLGTAGGLIAAPQPVTELLMTPGARYDVAVGPFSDGVTVAPEALPHDGGAGKPRRSRLATLHAARADGPWATADGDLGEFGRHIEPLARAAAEPTRVLQLGGRNTTHGVEGSVTGITHLDDVPVRVGALQVWELVNDSGVDRPFHLQGFYFQVLAVDGAPPPYASWEDTVNVPRRGRVRIAWLPDDRPGRWTYHCHLTGHHAVGTIGRFEVAL